MKTKIDLNTDKILVSVLKGDNGYVVAIGNYRIAGQKPRNSTTVFEEYINSLILKRAIERIGD